MGNLSGSLTCSVDANKGTLSVPAALMKKITGTPVNFDVIVHNTAWKAVGEWMMSFGGRTEYNPGRDIHQLTPSCGFPEPLADNRA